MENIVYIGSKTFLFSNVKFQRKICFISREFSSMPFHTVLSFPFGLVVPKVWYQKSSASTTSGLVRNADLGPHLRLLESETGR